MGKKDARVDEYISRSADFARPILEHLRAVVHEGCPEVVEEIKWRSPHFAYKGMFCGMSAFKRHCMFGFWRSDVLPAHSKEWPARGVRPNQHYRHIVSLADLPSRKALLKLVRAAKALSDSGVKSGPMGKPAPKKDRVLVVPAYITKAVRKNSKALKTWEGSSYSHKKEYVQWVTDAKTQETRDRRLATSVEWLAQGKGRNWKYER